VHSFPRREERKELEINKLKFFRKKERENRCVAGILFLPCKEYNLFIPLQSLRIAQDFQA